MYSRLPNIMTQPPEAMWQPVLPVLHFLVESQNWSMIWRWTWRMACIFVECKIQLIESILSQILLWTNFLLIHSEHIFHKSQRAPLQSAKNTMVNQRSFKTCSYFIDYYIILQWSLYWWWLHLYQAPKFYLLIVPYSTSNLKGAIVFVKWKSFKLHRTADSPYAFHELSNDLNISNIYHLIG